MSSSTLAQNSRSPQSADRQRKRRERAAKARMPEPKDIVSGAGQPLDPGVRRELEETLGHDLGRVRLHTDRDAAALTEMIGADAVAVGQDIFFSEGAYQPGLANGRRLLAHELLHTVQNPDGLGALRTGRASGAVSLPHDAAEREAETAARDLVRSDGEATPEAETQNEPGQAATPGWLRYATVNADRMRTEHLDPATLVDRLANGVLRSLRGDPTDLSGRVRLQLARMSPELQDSVLGRLETRLFTFEYERVLTLVDEADRLPTGFQPSDVPEPVPDLAEELAGERNLAFRAAEGDRQSERRRADEAREERADTRNRNRRRASEQSAAERDAAAEKQESTERRVQEDERARERAAGAEEQQQQEEAQAAERTAADQAGVEQAEEQQADVEQTKQERKDQRDREEQDPEQANEPGAEKRRRKDDERDPAAGSKPEDVPPKATRRPGPVRPERVDERAESSESALTKHGLHEKDEGEPREEEQPIGLEAGADRDIGGEDTEQAKGGAAGRGEPELKPEDYLPATDLDVSAVPTADRLAPEGAQPAVPTFPTPPPTKAELVERQREDEADEEEDGPETESKAPGEEQGPVEGEAPKPEGGPAAEAPDRTEKDLRPEKPLEQEVGPDPETADRERQEPEAEQKRDPGQQQNTDEDGARAARRDEDEKDSDTSDEQPDAKDAQEEQKENKEQAEQEEMRETRGQPAGAAADKPATTAAAATAKGSPAGAAALRPAGAHAEPTRAEDRNPSPAARGEAEPTKSEREAPAAKSRVPKETGPGAAPRGTVGGSEPRGPTAAAGPGGAPSAAQAAVSPAADQAASPGAMGAPAPQGTAPAPESSLEKDGGACAPPPPAPEKEQGKGCGAGGGGGAKEEKKPEPPDVSGQDPKAAVQTVSKLPPDQAQAAMPQVGQAADNKIVQEQQRLDGNPPTRERPSGAPQTESAPPRAAAPAALVTGPVKKLGPEERIQEQQAKGGERAEGAQPTENVAPPPLPPANQEITAENAKDVEAAADAVPTVDPELRNKTVGPAPKIKLEGESDPKRTDDQAKELKEKQAEIQDTGRADAAKPMGEDKIFPNAPRERLVGSAPPGGGKAAGPAISAGSPVEPGVGVVAQQEKGAELRSGADQAQSQMVTKEKEHQQGEQGAKRQQQVEINREVEQNAATQTAERGRAAAQVNAERQQWRDEQDAKITEADSKTEKEHTSKNAEIVKTRDDKDKEVENKKNEDNKQIDNEREKAEQKAEKEKEEKKNDGGGFFGWIADKVKGFFEGLLKAVTAIFDAARKLVNGIIDGFKKLANAAIDFVRDLAIKAINVLADVLIAIGDVLLAAFPELRDRFRRAIEGLRDRAIAAVNALADGLKKAVNALLDALAAGLNALLSALEGAIKFVIKAYQAVILGAIKFAQAAIAALGRFAALIADIVPDIGGWIAKAGSAIKTGVSDYLWPAIKTAVKSWFDTKVEGILGLGKAIINVLIKGCLSLKQIAKMAWDAIIASLPMIIISLVIEKVVSLIVPAAGAILTIVQGLMAAWQSISSILTAFGKFWAFLKGVKAGPAACLFAEFVAAGVVALLDFITNFLLIRLSMATKGVGKRLNALAQKIMKGLKKTGKGARKAAGAAVNRARAATRKAQQAIRKPPGPAKPKGPRVPARSKTAADRTPGATRRPPTRRDPDRPPSRTPDRTKQHRRDQDEANRDREVSTVPPTRRPDVDRTPDTPRPGSNRTRDTDKPKQPDPKKVKPPEKPDGQGRTSDKPVKRKEVEAPKRTKPRKPKSSPGRALKKASGAVKSALRKVRNSSKALGRKLKKSKVGRALRNSAKKLRDTYRRRRDKLRDQHRTRRRDRDRQRHDERRRREKTPDSKQQRLNRTLARIRPKLTQLLKRGAYRSIYRAVLTGMKVWYRLTSLAPKGFPLFDTIARLNPSGNAGRGEYEWKKEPRAEPEHEPQHRKPPANRNKSPSTGRTESANPHGVRRDWPTDPTTGERLTRRDFKFLGWRMKQVRWWMRGEAPLGMTPEIYQEWRSSLLKALERDGITPDDVDVRLLGSASEGFSGPRKPLWTDEELTGRPRAQRILREWLGDDRTRLSRRPFDSGYRFGVGKIRGGERSDYDTNISGDKLVERAREHFESLPEDERPGKFFSGSHEYVSKDIIAQVFPNLQRWARDWSKQLGRDVSHAVFRSTGPTFDPNFATHFRDDVDWIVHRPGGR